MANIAQVLDRLEALKEDVDELDEGNPTVKEIKEELLDLEEAIKSEIFHLSVS